MCIVHAWSARLMEQFKVEHFTGIIRSRAAKFYDSDTRRFVWDAPIILQLLLFKTTRKNQQKNYKKGLLKKCFWNDTNI